MKKQIGKNTLGGGKGMAVSLNEYRRSSHNLSYAWRSSMTVGTLVPFMKLVALPGDTFEIELDTKVLTHPTVGPLFGSYKLQLDIFQCPMRLYMAPLHNNALNVGMNMEKIKIPQFIFTGRGGGEPSSSNNYNPWGAINPSSLLRYLGCQSSWYAYNAIPLLAYLDIFKNYYANKQEENYYALMGNQESVEIIRNESNLKTKVINGVTYTGAGSTIKVATSSINSPTITFVTWSPETNVWTEKDMTDPDIFSSQVSGNYTIFTSKIDILGLVQSVTIGNPITINEYPLEELDDLREYLLAQGYAQVTLSDTNGGNTQYIKDLLSKRKTEWQAKQPLSGLLLKTYQSDVFSNWVQTEWIDGENGINAVTAVDTSEGSFTMDSLNLAQKVYNMLNRIAISDGSFKDWIDVVYTSGYELHAETPIYEGGTSSEIEFQEVVSNSATEGQPLGTIAGRGVNTRKKNGRLKIKVKEPSYIIGIVSITPRVDYAEGNDWDMIELQTMNDLHKPALDGIGYQDLITPYIEGWQTREKAVGKQPAWINYMTAVNRVYGNFAIEGNEMFMTLVRKPDLYGNNGASKQIKWSSYIEPSLYNYIFADNRLDAQNFWVQIGCGIRARRVMSAKQIPNL